MRERGSARGEPARQLDEALDRLAELALIVRE
jgi:hypothetical protein